jgi:hypothetical protein
MPYGVCWVREAEIFRLNMSHAKHEWVRENHSARPQDRSGNSGARSYPARHAGPACREIDANIIKLSPSKTVILSNEFGCLILLETPLSGP